MKHFSIALILLLCFVLVGCVPQNVDESAVLIEDVEQFSRISLDELKNIMGEPVFEENWTNKTSKGDFLVSTLAYDKNGNHYEFIIADNSVVRLSLYSEDYWKNTGERFKYRGAKKDICKSFNVALGDNAALVADTGYAYRIRPVNDKVADFWIQDFDGKTYGFIKVTYNLNYFD